MVGRSGSLPPPPAASRGERLYPQPGMRRAVTTACLSVALLVLTAPLALAAEGHDGGEGWWGETNDKVITNAGFALIIFFPLFILVMSLIQHRLDTRKDARKAAEKDRKSRADVRGGW
jgi:hypothetical protein